MTANPFSYLPPSFTPASTHLLQPFDNQPHTNHRATHPQKDTYYQTKPYVSPSKTIDNRRRKVTFDKSSTQPSLSAHAPPPSIRLHFRHKTTTHPSAPSTSPPRLRSKTAKQRALRINPNHNHKITANSIPFYNKKGLFPLHLPYIPQD